MIKSSPVGDIRETRLADALGERYLAYALSTIVSRSLPDVRDGLKPVHRRLLYAMQQLKLDPTQGFKKCARVVGDVIGKYHPHGDVAVYDAMVRLAQDFAVRYPLVDGQGNFGNIDGDNAAAMRYTEARLTAVATALLDGLNENAVDFRETYDGTESEPVVLPAAFPNLLANGATGIAVGMATSIPPHNVAELCNALLHLIKYPNARIEKLVDFIPGPDLPTGGILVESRESIVESYATGRGGFRLRARWNVEKLPQGQYQIIVTEIPYQVMKSRLIEKIADLINARKVPMLTDIRDESSDDIRIVLEPKSRTVDSSLLMEHLFRLSDLESRISLNLNVLNARSIPGVMSLGDALWAFLEHRHEVLKRRSQFRLDKIVLRLETLDGLLIAYLNLDKVIKIVRSEDEPKPVLIKAFKLTDLQAESILNMRLRQLRKLDEKGIKTEHKSLTSEAKLLRSLLRDENKRWKVIAAEINDTKKTYGPKTGLGRRRTEIGSPPDTVVVPIETMIEKEPVTVVCSEKGWIRTIKGHIEDASKLRYKEGDRELFVLSAQTTDKILFFATNGRFYTVPCERLPGGRGFGEPVRMHFDLPEGDDIICLFIFQGERKFVVASDSGRGFIVAETDVLAQTRSGKQALNLGDGEEASVCHVITEKANMVAILGQNRKLLVFDLDELPVMTRGRGVILQRYKTGGLADITTFRKSTGLSWRRGTGTHTEKNIKKWVGKRAQAGMLPPKGFTRSNRFG